MGQTKKQGDTMTRKRQRKYLGEKGRKMKLKKKRKGSQGEMEEKGKESGWRAED